MKTWIAWWVCMTLALCGAGLLAGCEATKSTDTVITVTPGEAPLTGEGATETFKASLSGTNSTSALALPLVWSVSDSSLGSIKASSGVTAVYESTGKVGNNVITVHDQGEAEGIATVNQQ